MNLVTDKWIPVIKGSIEEKVSLIDIFSDDSILDLAVSSSKRIVLTRLLICISHAGLKGPNNVDELFECKNNFGEKAIEYLKKWQSKFELYGKESFINTMDLEDKNDKNLDCLDPTLATGNSHTLFDHGATVNGREHSDDWIALHALVSKMFFKGGGMDSNLPWNGTTIEKKKEKSRYVFMEKSKINVFLKGENFLESIWLNLLPYDYLKKEGIKIGNPIWEKMPNSFEDKEAISNATETYLGRLVGLPKLIKLNEGSSKITMTEGLQYDSLPIFKDPFSTTYLSKEEELKYLPLRNERDVVRDLHIILMSDIRNKNKGLKYNTLILNNLREIYPKLGEKWFELWIGGKEFEKGDGFYSKPLYEGEKSIRLPFSALGETFVKLYQEGMNYSNTIAYALQKAVKKYQDERNSGSKFYVNSCLLKFWHYVDANSRSLIKIADKNLGLEEWNTQIKRKAYDIYDKTMPHSKSRDLKAFVMGKNVLVRFKSFTKQKVKVKGNKNGS